MKPHTSIVALLVAGGLVCAVAGCGGGSAEAQTALSAAEQAAAEAESYLPMGIELGQFELREIHPVEGTRSTLTFTLYASVRERDADRLEELLENRRYKVRDHVMTAVRTAALDELDDPDLATLRRRVKLRLARFLPELTFDDILVTDFNFSLDK